MENRKCIICGNIFKPHSHNQKICNKEHTAVCPICGKTYRATIASMRCFSKYGTFSACSAECSKLKIKQTKLEKYGSENYNNSDKSKQTKLECYGDCNYNNSQKAYNTKLEKYGNGHYRDIEKTKQTKLEKYGDKNYNNREKYKETCMSKFGETSPLKNTEIKNKMIVTMQNRYGYNSPLQNEEIKQKRLSNELDKYGVNNHTQLHYAEYTRNVLFNRDNFYNFCKSIEDKLTYVYASSLLQIQDTTFKSYFIKYGMDELFKLKGTPYKENHIGKLLDNLNIEYEQHNRTLIYPKELDFYIPSKCVAIEYNGTYWHSDKKKENKNYHYDKSKLCEEKGIRLIHIFEYEWENERQRPILENIIRNAIGINENKVYARNCTISVKKPKELKDFFNRNNIQGFRNGKFAICLEYKNKIIMSYIFGHPYFGKGKYECEVIRGATELGYTVVGGASKIWKYFIEQYNYNNCVYYIDYNYFNGNSMKNLPEMKFIKTQPSFKNWWVQENVVKNRDPKHHKEIRKLEEQGLVVPIYNAGTKVYLWERI